MRRIARRAALAIGSMLSIIAALLAFPQPLFSHSMEHGQFKVWSDRPISPRIAEVLDDATRRMRTSELYKADDQYRIFICNEPWRMSLFARNRLIGGSADILFSRNIYLREADIPANRILPPDPHADLADADVRPMSYFVAHEATHIMTSRAFGRLTAVTSPQWLMDGYADLVAKAGEFDVEENRRLLRSGDPQLDHARSGLYRGYHLMVATLMSRKGKSIRSLFEAPPAEEEALTQAWSAD